MNTLSMFFRQLLPAFLAVLAFTLLCGIAYPVAIWAVSRFDADTADGSPVTDAHGCVVGSALLGVDPQAPKGKADPFFHARLSGDSDATDPVESAMAPGDPAGGSPSNLGPSNPQLAEWIKTRREVIAAREHVKPETVPVDAVTGSGSGLDPHISPEYAELQVPRIAKATGKSEQHVRELIAEHTTGRGLGFLGQRAVNVTTLNVALGHTAPNCHTATS